MASAFGHALAAVAIGKLGFKEVRSARFWILGIICSILPDADVIAFQFDIPYEHMFGHRGFTHSLVFAAIMGFIVTIIFYRRISLFSLKGMSLVLFFFMCTASHAFLDAFTDGGLGVAFFSPFDNTRYFFPWRPIKVSPIGVDSFFSEWGMRVVKSEMFWIGLPCVGIITLSIISARNNKRKN